jgi:uncharacterized protein (DUF302 family)
MSYYFSKILSVSFDEAVVKVIESLKKEGFGVLTEIDVKTTMNPQQVQRLTQAILPAPLGANVQMEDVWH